MVVLIGKHCCCLFLIVGLLAACSPPQRPQPLSTPTTSTGTLPMLSPSPGRLAVARASSPEQRVEMFFQDFITALNDPAIDDPQQQSKLADQIVQHIVPSQREELSKQFAAALGESSSALDTLEPFEKQLQIQIDFTLTDFSARVIEQNENDARVVIERSMLAGTVSGATKDSLLPNGVIPGSEADISSLLTSGGSKEVRLIRQDGDWYISLEDR